MSNEYHLQVKKLSPIKLLSAKLGSLENLDLNMDQTFKQSLVNIANTAKEQVG